MRDPEPPTAMPPRLSLCPAALLLAATLLLGACAGQAVRAPAATAPASQAAVDAAPVEVAGSMAEVDGDREAASARTSTSGQDAVVTLVDAPAQSAAASDTQPHASSQAADTSPTAATDTQQAPTAAEDDFNALYGNPEYDPVADATLPPGVEMPSSYDPWEPFNRRVHAFNNFFDRHVAAPLARLYVKAIPRPVRLGVSNFFNNLGQPVSAANALLQGRPRDAGFALLRFGINSTLGLGGVFDPASKLNIPYRDEDFGQTLAIWGWRKSRYIELPIFGPRTARDIFGMVGDTPLSPLPHIGRAKAQMVLRSLQLADIRARLFSVDSMRENVVDEYALYRDAWLQRRNYQIMSGLRDGKAQQADNLPDYLQDEEDNPSVPIDAIPIRP